MLDWNVKHEELAFQHCLQIIHFTKAAIIQFNNNVYDNAVEPHTLSQTTFDFVATARQLVSNIDTTE